MAGILTLLRWLAPSALTISALLSGLSAVRFAAEDDFGWSVTCVMMAAVLDGLDGHVARYLDACTKIGFELDSLCDLANFGVSPALIVYFWAKTLPVRECRSDACAWEHKALWFSCCFYAACCASRLARFNVAGHAAQMDQGYPAPAARKRSVPKVMIHNFFQRQLYFKGVPAPVGAAYALAPMMLRFSTVAASNGIGAPARGIEVGRLGTAATLLVTGALMVSTLPTFSSKMFKVSASDSILRSQHWCSRMSKVLAGASLAYVGWLYPFDVFLVLNLGHLFSTPIGVIIYYGLASAKSD